MAKEPIDKIREEGAEPEMVRQLSVFFLANGSTAAQVFYVHEGDTIEVLPYEYLITHADGVVERVNRRMIAYERDRMIRKRKMPETKKDDE